MGKCHCWILADVVDLREKSLRYKAGRKVVEFFPVERRETESTEVRGKIQECLLSFARFSLSAVRCFELTDSVLKLSFPMSFGGSVPVSFYFKRSCKGNENRLLRLDASLILKVLM